MDNGISPAKRQKVANGTNNDAKSEKKSGYLKVQKDPENSVSVLFSLPEKVGALAQVLKIFEVHQVNLHHIESRPSKQSSTEFEFFVSCDNKTGGLKETLDEVKGIAKTFRVYSRKTGEYPSEDVDNTTTGNMKSVVIWVHTIFFLTALINYFYTSIHLVQIYTYFVHV